MNEENSKIMNSPKRILKMLSKELPPEDTPQELRINASKPSANKETIASRIVKARNTSDISNNTLSLSNFTSLSFGLDDSEEDLLRTRGEHFREKLRKKRAENPYVMSESVLRTPAPTENTIDDLGLSMVSLDESIEINKAKIEIQKKRKRRNRTEVELLNLTNAISKLNEVIVDNDDLNENDSIDLGKKNNPKSQFRKKRKSVHFDLSPLINEIPKVNKADLKSPSESNIPISEDSMSNLSSEQSESLKSHENNLEKSPKRKGLESSKNKAKEIESPKSKEKVPESPKSKEKGSESPQNKENRLESPKSGERGLKSPKRKKDLESPVRKQNSLVSLGDDSILFGEQDSKDNEDSLFLESNFKLKNKVYKRKKSITFDIDDFISQMKRNKSVIDDEDATNSLGGNENLAKVNKSMGKTDVTNVDENANNTSDIHRSKQSIYLSPDSIRKELESPKSIGTLIASINEQVELSKSGNRTTSTYSEAVDSFSPSKRLKRSNRFSLSPKSVEKRLESSKVKSLSLLSSPRSSTYHLGSSESGIGNRLSPIPKSLEKQSKSPKSTPMNLRSSPISTSYNLRSPSSRTSDRLNHTLTKSPEKHLKSPPLTPTKSSEKQLKSPKSISMNLRSSPISTSYNLRSPRSRTSDRLSQTFNKSPERLVKSPSLTSSKSPEKQLKSPRSTPINLRSSPMSTSHHSESPKSGTSNRLSLTLTKSPEKQLKSRSLTIAKSSEKQLESPKSAHMNLRSSPKSSFHSKSKSGIMDLSHSPTSEKQLESPKTTQMSLRSSPKSANLHFVSPKSISVDNLSSNQQEQHKSQSSKSVSPEVDYNKSNRSNLPSSPSPNSTDIHLESIDVRRNLFSPRSSPRKLSAARTSNTSSLTKFPQSNESELDTHRPTNKNISIMSPKLIIENQSRSSTVEVSSDRNANINKFGSFIEEKINSSKENLSLTRRSNLNLEIEENNDKITDFEIFNPDTSPRRTNLPNTRTVPVSSPVAGSSTNPTGELLTYPNTNTNFENQFGKSFQGTVTINRNKKGRRSTKGSPTKPSTSKSGQLTLKEFLGRLKCDQPSKKSEPDLFQEMIKKPKDLLAINEKYEKEKAEKKKDTPKKEKGKAKTKTNLPPKMNDAMFQHFLKHKLTKEGSEVLQEIVGEIFTNLAEDLQVILTSSNDKLINKNHLYLLMKQLKIVSNWEDLYALTEQLLPANEWKKLVPIQYAHNKVFPQPPRGSS